MSKKDMITTPKMFKFWNVHRSKKTGAKVILIALISEIKKNKINPQVTVISLDPSVPVVEMRLRKFNELFSELPFKKQGNELVRIENCICSITNTLDELKSTRDKLSEAKLNEAYGSLDAVHFTGQKGDTELEEFKKEVAA